MITQTHEAGKEAPAEQQPEQVKPKKEKKQREPRGPKVYRPKQAAQTSEQPAAEAQPIQVVTQEEADDDTESLLRKTVDHESES